MDAALKAGAARFEDGSVRGSGLAHGGGSLDHRVLDV
jgi:hypothetical protein